MSATGPTLSQLAALLRSCSQGDIADSSPAVLLSKEWAEAGEKGRWSKEVRPHTTNRSHIVRKVIG